MKRLDNGMKPSEYLRTPEGRSRAKAFIMVMFSLALQYPQIHVGVYLYADGTMGNIIKPRASDWEITDNTVTILCEYNYSHDILYEYITSNLHTPKEVADYLLEQANTEQKQMWEARGREVGLDRWDVYDWFLMNASQAVRFAKGMLIDKSQDIDYDIYINRIIKKLEAEGN